MNGVPPAGRGQVPQHGARATRGTIQYFNADNQSVRGLQDPGVPSNVKITITAPDGSIRSGSVPFNTARGLAQDLASRGYNVTVNEKFNPFDTPAFEPPPPGRAPARQPATQPQPPVHEAGATIAPTTLTAFPQANSQGITAALRDSSRLANLATTPRPPLRGGGVSGNCPISFRILPNGTVDRNSIRVNANELQPPAKRAMATSEITKAISELQFAPSENATTVQGPLNLRRQ